MYIEDGRVIYDLRVAIRTEKFARLQRLIQPMITVKCFFAATFLLSSLTDKIVRLFFVLQVMS